MKKAFPRACGGIDKLLLHLLVSEHIQSLPWHQQIHCFSLFNNKCSSNPIIVTSMFCKLNMNNTCNNLSDSSTDDVQPQKSAYNKTKLGSIENPGFQLCLWQELLSLAGCISAAHLLAMSVFIRVTGLIRLFKRGWFKNSDKVTSFCQFAISYSQSIPDSSKLRNKGLNILIPPEKMNKKIMSLKSVIFFLKNKSGELLVKLTTMNVVCQIFQIPGN